jgi:thiaminase
MKQRILTELARFDRAATVAWDDKATYAEYLAQTYYYVCHSTRLLASAGARFGVDREKLHTRFLKHAAEERSHHVLAERDLAKLGYSLSDFPELPETCAFYETQYYRIEHVSPIAMFGYILALEGSAVIYGPAAYAAAKKAHGDPPTAFLRVHAEEDPSHLDTAFAMIDPLSESEQRLVLDNARFSLALYDGVIRAVIEGGQARRTSSGYPAAPEAFAATA